MTFYKHIVGIYYSDLLIGNFTKNNTVIIDTEYYNLIYTIDLHIIMF